MIKLITLLFINLRLLLSLLAQFCQKPLFRKEGSSFLVAIQYIVSYIIVELIRLVEGSSVTARVHITAYDPVEVKLYRKLFTSKLPSTVKWKMF